MKKTKRNIAIIVVLLFVCAAIYFNWSYNTQWGKADAEMAAAEDAATAAVKAEEDAAAASASTSDDYFANSPTRPRCARGDTVQAGYDSKYVFTDGVVVVPSSVAAEIADGGSVIIPDTTVALKEGDTFVVFVEDFPRAFKAGSIANDGKQLTVTGEKVDINSVLVSIDAQGVVKGDLAQMQPNEGTQITYILSDDTETPDLMAALNGEKPIKSIHLSRTISGVTVGCDITSIVGEYNIRASGAKILRPTWRCAAMRRRPVRFRFPCRPPACRIPLSSALSPWASSAPSRFPPEFPLMAPSRSATTRASAPASSIRPPAASA